ncbi:hypothetical protein [Bradyrhizobium sp. CCBAU 45384]|uniref:hypothetical protein n=1 Tax=Bradyrhizobium sp. CCBAU 45384 TaxID=858428 RepID=UPI002305C7C6|nr:hypothetical protein [Bradyrhizobium sp. CCBAU 45384]
MTLIAAAGNAKCTVIAADTRISWNGAPRDDQTVKVSHYKFFDGELIGAFTGLAYWNDFNSKRWWLGRLQEIAQPWVSTREALSFLRRDISAEFLSNPELKSLLPEQKKLSIIFGGLIDGLPFSALISNFEDYDGEFDSVRPEFILTKCDAIDTTAAWCGFFGARKHVTDADRQELYRLADTQAPTTAIKGKCHSIVLKASSDPRTRATVGPNVLTATLEGGIVSSWHSNEEEGDKIIGVDAFSSSAAGGEPMMIRDIEIVGSKIAPARSNRRGKRGKHKP